MTQAELAARLQRPQSFVAKVELGERQLLLLEFLGICEGLGLDPKEAVASFVS